jgi:hypothetical protein
VCVFIIDIQRSCPGSIVYSCVLKTPHLSTGENILEEKKLDIHLNAVARHLLFMAFKGLHGTLTLMLRQFVQAISSQDAINTCR